MSIVLLYIVEAACEALRQIVSLLHPAVGAQVSGVILFWY